MVRLLALVTLLVFSLTLLACESDNTKEAYRDHANIVLTDLADLTDTIERLIAQSLTGDSTAASALFEAYDQTNRATGLALLEWNDIEIPTECRPLKRSVSGYLSGWCCFVLQSTVSCPFSKVS